MQPDWVTAQSYQHSQSIIVAINDFSLGAKLARRGIRTREREHAVEAAREVIRFFLNQIEVLAEQAETATDKPLIGAAPNLCALAKTFVQARRGRSPNLPRLRDERIGEIRSLLDSDDPANQERLLGYLAELRALLEEHIEAEAGEIMGEL